MRDIIHRVKTLPEYFNDLLLSKDFEIRKDIEDMKRGTKFYFWSGMVKNTQEKGYYLTSNIFLEMFRNSA